MNSAEEHVYPVMRGQLQCRRRAQRRQLQAGERISRPTLDVLAEVTGPAQELRGQTLGALETHGAPLRGRLGPVERSKACGVSTGGPSYLTRRRSGTSRHTMARTRPRFGEPK